MASTPSKVLVLGASGMLGHRLCDELAGEFEVSATVRSPSAVPAGLVDARVELIAGVTSEDFQSLVSTVAHVRPHVVVNCIGVVKQAAAALDPIQSIGINALFPHRLADLCTAADARFLHISTDCVFSGRKGDYREADEPDPVDLYGRTKHLGEVASEGTTTIRTSMIGPEIHSAHGLFEWFLRQEGGTVRGYTRAIFSGFTTAALSSEIVDLVSSDRRHDGVWHVAADPIDKYDLLTRIRDAMGIDVEIEPDESVVCDRSLNDSRYRGTTGTSPPSWGDMIEQLARETHARARTTGV